MNSDELGSFGESTFETVCLTGKLIANKAQRDRSGWDYTVEFPIVHSENAELDNRQNPPSCLFQVKAMWEHNDQIKLRLSSIERIAKDPKPSFIYVMKVSKDNEVKKAYLVHLRGDNLEKVLRKLRAEREAGRFAVNNTFMYVNATSVGKEIGIKGSDLKDAINDEIGPDVDKYINHKRNELDNLGYKQAPREIKFTIHAKNKEELAQIFFGEKSAVVSDVEHFETRFDIRLSTKVPFVTESIKFNIFPIDTCTVVVRRDRFADPAVFRGSLFMPPRNAPIEFGAKIKTDLFEIVYRDQSLSVKTKPIVADEPSMSPADWRNYFLFVEAISREGCTFEVRPTNPRMKSVKLPRIVPNKEIDIEVVASQIEIVGRLNSLVQASGSKDDVTLNLGQIVQQMPDINSAYALMSGDGDLSPLEFSTDSIIPINGNELTNVLHVNFIRFKEKLLVWSAAATVSRVGDGEVKYRSEALEFEEITFVSLETYDEYINDKKRSGRYAVVMSRVLSSRGEISQGDDGTDEVVATGK